MALKDAAALDNMGYQEEISFPKIKGAFCSKRLLESLKSLWKTFGELSLKSPEQLQGQLGEGSASLLGWYVCICGGGWGGTNFLFGHSALAKRRKGPCCLFCKFLGESRVANVEVLWMKGWEWGQPWPLFSNGGLLLLQP